AQGLAGDMSDPAAPHALAGAAAALLGPIDLLVHNASTLGVVPLVPLGDTPDDAFDAALATNLIGPFRLSRAIVGGMVLPGGGLVVHVTSDAGGEAYPNWGAYGVSKAGFDQLARIWAAELAGTGVGFLTVDPGEMDTRMHADAVPDADRSLLADPRAVAARIVSQIEATQ